MNTLAIFIEEFSKRPCCPDCARKAKAEYEALLAVADAAKRFLNRAEGEYKTLTDGQFGAFTTSTREGAYLAQALAELSTLNSRP